MDTGWMEDCVYKYLRREITAEEYERRVDACNIFERQLRDNGYIVVKLFSAYFARGTALAHRGAAREYRYRVARNGRRSLAAQRSTRPSAVPTASLWRKRPSAANGTFSTPGTGKKRLLAGFRAITEAIDNGLENGRCIGKTGKSDFPLLGTPSLRDADLTKSVAPEEYKAELKRLQEKLAALHNKIYRKRIPRRHLL